jgi:hypothetical protein
VNKNKTFSTRKSSEIIEEGYPEIYKAIRNKESGNFASNLNKSYFSSRNFVAWRK